jgi:hypothetical protein
MRDRRKVLAASIAAAVSVVLIGPVGAARADVSSATDTSASCVGIEAAALSPPGSSDEAPGGIPDVKAFLDENFPGVPAGLAFFSFVARLHEGSHEGCDEALGE